jgi:hypothetical protein
MLSREYQRVKKFTKKETPSTTEGIGNQAYVE